jgi:hypothetical protein
VWQALHGSAASTFQTCRFASNFHAQTCNALS